jgi:hypothetical protein
MLGFTNSVDKSTLTNFITPLLKIVLITISLNDKQHIFSHLFITGDWLITDVNAGKLTTVTIVGIETSIDVCAFPKVINSKHGG